MKSSENPKNPSLNDRFVGFCNRIINAVLNFLHLSKYKEQVMYLIVGGGTTVVDWIVFTVLVLILPDLSSLAFFKEFPTAIPYTLGWMMAVLFAYWASKYFVFESAKKEGSAQFFRFVLSRVATLLFSLLGDFVLTGKLAMNEFLAKAIISVIVVIVNYITSKFLVFNRKEEPKQENDEGEDHI